jgi:AcrR family transcriptional regulator
MTSESHPPVARRGAVRSEAARQAILQATAHQFATRGWEHLSIEGIASEAGVGKQTIYRWWPTKGALVSECLLEGMLISERLSLPDTGDLRTDLRTWLDRILALLEEPNGQGLLTSLIAAASDNVEIGRKLHDSLGVESSVTQRLASAVDAGQLPASAPLTETSEALIGAVIVRALGRIPPRPGDADRLLDVIIGAET